MNILHRCTWFVFACLPMLAAAKTSTALFNGADLQGWYAYEPVTGKHSDASELFGVADHTIRLYGPKAGYLMSAQSFHDFRLTVEFRWNTDPSFTRKSNSINSGVMYLVPQETPDALWPTGIQFQIKEGSTGDFVFLGGTTLTLHDQTIEPGRSVVSKRFADAEKPLGEWNTFTVTVAHDTITQVLNGVVVNQGIKPSVKQGRILLMYEGYPIDFRKVAVESLVH